jgi:hypothetical protein
MEIGRLSTYADSTRTEIVRPQWDLKVFKISGGKAAQRKVAEREALEHISEAEKRRKRKREKGGKKVGKKWVKSGKKSGKKRGKKSKRRELRRAAESGVKEVKEQSAKCRGGAEERSFRGFEDRCRWLLHYG